MIIYPTRRRKTNCRRSCSFAWLTLMSLQNMEIVEWRRSKMLNAPLIAIHLPFFIARTYIAVVVRHVRLLFYLRMCTYVLLQSVWRVSQSDACTVRSCCFSYFSSVSHEKVRRDHKRARRQQRRNSQRNGFCQILIGKKISVIAFQLQA